MSLYKKASCLIISLYIASFPVNASLDGADESICQVVGNYAESEWIGKNIHKVSESERKELLLYIIKGSEYFKLLPDTAKSSFLNMTIRLSSDITENNDASPEEARNRVVKSCIEENSKLLKIVKIKEPVCRNRADIIKVLSMAKNSGIDISDIDREIESLIQDSDTKIIREEIHKIYSLKEKVISSDYASDFYDKCIRM